MSRHRKRTSLAGAERVSTHLQRSFDDPDSFCKLRETKRQERCVRCTAVSSLLYCRYWLSMPQVAMPSLGIGAMVSPETFSRGRRMPPRRVTTPMKLIETWGLTVRSYRATKPNGAKLNAAATVRHRFARRQTLMADNSLRAPRE